MSKVLPLSDDTVIRAAQVYADLYRRGELIDDADILIGAAALEHGLVLATNNTEHYRRIPGLRLINWLV